MANVSTTKMSSKGQVVIPEAIRERLGLKTGAQFVVVADRDVVILKVLEPPALSEFAALTAHLDSLYAASPLALSLNVQEFHPVLNFKKNNLHEYVKRRGGKP